jgi:hypothetical protein
VFEQFLAGLGVGSDFTKCPDPKVVTIISSKKYSKQKWSLSPSIKPKS